MMDPEKRSELHNALLTHLEAALAITDELQDGLSGYLIESAIDHVRAGLWPANLDMPPKPRR